jgi:chemotaxis protein CheD
MTNMEKEFLKPGTVLVPQSSSMIQTVVTYGVAISFYDKVKKVGGMAHYLYPIREKDKPSTALYAAPAISVLLSAFFTENVRPEDLEIHIYGGANPDGASIGYINHTRENLKVAREILFAKNILLFEESIGGSRGRKIMFNSETGEVVVAKVDGIRSVDWMIHPDGPIER